MLSFMLPRCGFIYAKRFQIIVIYCHGSVRSSARALSSIYCSRVENGKWGMGNAGEQEAAP